MSIYDTTDGNMSTMAWRMVFRENILIFTSLLFAGMVEGDKCNTTKSLSSTGKYCPHQI